MNKKPSYKDLEQQVKDLQHKVRTLQQENCAQPDTDIPGGALLYSLIQSLPLNIYAKSTSGHFTFANNYYCESVDLPHSAILNKTDHDVHPGDLAEKYIADDQKVMDTRQSMSFEEDWKSLNGKKNYVHVIKSPIFDAESTSFENPTVIGTLGIFWDITEKKLAEINLQQSEEKYRNILESIEEGYFELNTVLQLTFFNDSFCKIIGYSQSELTSKHFSKLVDKKHTDALHKINTEVILHSKPLFLTDIRISTKEHSTVHLELSLSPILDQHKVVIGARGVARNITTRIQTERVQKNLKTQLNQSQKLESLGNLAGGIAHDFNNILFLITGYTDLALLDVVDKIDPTESLQKIKSASTRATDLVSQILTFARRGERKHNPIDITTTIYTIEKLLTSALPSNIDIQTDITPTSPSIINGNETELHQIMMNLGVNAGHAIGEQNGKIIFKLENIIIDERLAKLQAGLNPGPYALLTISDTGTGISKKNLKRIFEPFFTTKKTGEGTGLGLSVVHGIIAGMGGVISVSSKKHGTSFQIFLPLLEQIPTLPREKTQTIINGNQEHILLVDDDKEIRHMVKGMLRDLNYHCTTAKNGLDGLEKYKKNKASFACILTDQTMPVMTGIEMSKKILSESPDAKIILCTGFSHNITEKDAENIGIKKYINKPVLIIKLSNILHELIH